MKKLLIILTLFIFSCDEEDIPQVYTLIGKWNLTGMEMTINSGAGSEGGCSYDPEQNQGEILSVTLDANGYCIWEFTMAVFEGLNASYTFSDDYTFTMLITENNTTDNFTGTWSTTGTEIILISDENYELHQTHNALNLNGSYSISGNTLRMTSYRLATDEEGNTLDISLPTTMIYTKQ